MVDQLQTLIQENDKIIIFRHLVGDGDALGSQWAMYYYLKEKYPNKEIYAVGDDTSGFENIFEKPHQISDDKFSEALAIILDTANTERIADDRYKLCKTIVKIDHHLEVDKYGDVNLVYPEVSSTAQIVAIILKEIEKGQPLSVDVAKNLYTGIISDTQMFSIPSVDKNTFMTAAYLSESNIEVGKITRQFHEIDLYKFQFKNAVANNIVIDKKGLAYLKVTNSDLVEHKLSHAEAKNSVNIMKNIAGINIWVLFSEQADKPNCYDASIRSNEVLINDVAREFNGGGHKFASGVKNLSESDIVNLLNKLKSKL